MTEAHNATDVAALAKTISDVSEFRLRVCAVIAHAILASDWLAERDARVRAEALSKEG